MSVNIEASLDEMEEVANYLIAETDKEGIIILRGDLASGKTTLASKIASKITDSEGAVSPTFSLQHRYSDRLFHYDLYRIDFEELVSLGLLEEFERDGLHIVEWADERVVDLLSSAGYKLWIVDITPTKKGRVYEIQKLDS